MRNQKLYRRLIDMTDITKEIPSKTGEFLMPKKVSILKREEKPSHSEMAF
jgi:hypothetical protein